MACEALITTHSCDVDEKIVLDIALDVAMVSQQICVSAHFEILDRNRTRYIYIIYLFTVIYMRSFAFYYIIFCIIET